MMMMVVVLQTQPSRSCTLNKIPPLLMGSASSTPILLSELFHTHFIVGTLPHPFFNVRTLPHQFLIVRTPPKIQNCHRHRYISTCLQVFIRRAVYVRQKPMCLRKNSIKGATIGWLGGRGGCSGRSMLQPYPINNDAKYRYKYKY